jgi:hypothetical protein
MQSSPQRGGDGVPAALRRAPTVQSRAGRALQGRPPRESGTGAASGAALAVAQAPERRPCYIAWTGWQGRGLGCNGYGRWEQARAGHLGAPRRAPDACCSRRPVARPAAPRRCRGGGSQSAGSCMPRVASPPPVRSAHAAAVRRTARTRAARPPASICRRAPRAGHPTAIASPSPFHAPARRERDGRGSPARDLPHGSPRAPMGSRATA